jgi:hypothetical protein
MPESNRDQTAIDHTVQNGRLGSIMLTAGWILLWMDALLSVYLFSSARDGSLFWPIWIGIEGVLGLGLVIAGTHYRRAVGVTTLSRHDIADIERQERREEQESKRVA